MPDDHYVPKGLTTPQMAKVANECRRRFEIEDVDQVDIIEILEFKLPKAIPGFRLQIREDPELDSTAFATTEPPAIFVRESIYEAACEGAPDCRRILAHELGHILLHRDRGSSMHRSLGGYNQIFKNTNSKESVEDQADMFARHFLIPPWLAYKHRNDDPIVLSTKTGTPPWLAKGSITLSKRPEMLAVMPPNLLPDNELNNSSKLT